MPGKVLLIDSDREASQSTASLLEQEGFEVLQASSFQQFHQAMTEAEPKVVVIEPVLDGIDGFELCRALLSVYSTSRPAIFLASTKLCGRVPREKARNVGAGLFLERPAMDPLLVDAVRRAMDDLPAVAAVPRLPDPPRSFPIGLIVATSVLILAGLFLVVRARTAAEEDPPPLSVVIHESADRREPDAPAATAIPAWLSDPSPNGSGVGNEKAPRVVTAIVPQPTSSVAMLPALPVKVAPRLISGTRVDPIYPDGARLTGTGGTVVLRGIVQTDGSLRELEVVEDPAPRLRLGRAALSAVRRWKYEPATREGRPVEMPIRIDVQFEPGSPRDGFRLAGEHGPRVRVSGTEHLDDHPRDQFP